MDVELHKFIRKLARFTGDSDLIAGAATIAQERELADEVRNLAAKLRDQADTIAIRDMMKSDWHGSHSHDNIDAGKLDSHPIAALIIKAIKYGRENNL